MADRLTVDFEAWEDHASWWDNESVEGHNSLNYPHVCEEICWSACWGGVGGDLCPDFLGCGGHGVGGGAAVGGLPQARC